jgi:hypothetical protein
MKDNSYRFEFAAPYFEEEKKTKYQTYLEGFDQDWVDWNDNTFKEYTNLSAGGLHLSCQGPGFYRESKRGSGLFLCGPTAMVCHLVGLFVVCLLILVG